MKLFLDANVLFTAAHNPHGKASLVIELAGTGVWDAITCAFAVEEALRNIEVKFPTALRRLETIIGKIGVLPTVLGGSCNIELPVKDLPIFLTAVQSKCTHLLTGDLRHFGKYMNQPKKTSGIVIQQVSEFLDCFVR